MKQIILCSIFIFFNGFLFCQPLKINWSNHYGGSNGESGYNIIKKNDMYILGIASSSNDVQMQGLHGTAPDYGLIFIDSNGTFISSQLYGGNKEEHLSKIILTKDNGYLLFGDTYSSNLSDYHGGGDFFLTKTDSIGNKKWQKCYGGSNQEIPGRTIIQTADSGYQLTGLTLSKDGNISFGHGWDDFWNVRLDKNGTIVSERTYGGTGIDESRNFLFTKDGGMLMCGMTSSWDGQANCESHGGFFDGWLVKIDSCGEIQWQRCYGGSGEDNLLQILEYNDSSYLICAISNSQDGQVIGNHGSWDIWIFVVDNHGEILWQKSIGASSDDTPEGIISSNGNYFIYGYTYSTDGIFNDNHSSNNNTDGFLIKLSPTGEIIWSRCFGGDNNDFFNGALEIKNNSFLLIGGTHSQSSGDVTFNTFGTSTDVWLVSVSDTSITGINETLLPDNLKIYHEIEIDIVRIEVQNNENSTNELIIVNELGQVVKTFKCLPGKNYFSWHPPIHGLYICSLSGKYPSSKKIIQF